jgi:acyl-coenzyme A thioesterase PaaI-like protein
VSVDRQVDTPQHVLQELGHAVTRVGDELHGRASITPEMHVPGTSNLRASILVIWADVLTGLLAAETTAPIVPVTVELDMHLYEPAPGSGTVHGTAKTVKSGRSVFVARAEFTTGSGQPIAFAAASFMTPDTGARLPSFRSIDVPPSNVRLSVPLAERAGCQRREPGVAVMARSEDGLNSSNTVNGGLIALVAEEAALSLSPGTSLCSLGLRYLQPVRIGPVVATASEQHGLGQVELRDAGSDDRLAAMATTRTFNS